jgi:hypothetical protein
MIRLLCFALAVLASSFKSRLRLEAENAVLRHQSSKTVHAALLLLMLEAVAMDLGFTNGAEPQRPKSSAIHRLAGRLRRLYAFVIVRINRRDLAWINITANPTAEWVTRQITEAFP